jgi:hypothetical protein
LAVAAAIILLQSPYPPPQEQEAVAARMISDGQAPEVEGKMTGTGDAADPVAPRANEPETAKAHQAAREVENESAPQPVETRDQDAPASSMGFAGEPPLPPTGMDVTRDAGRKARTGAAGQGHHRGGARLLSHAAALENPVLLFLANAASSSPIPIRRISCAGCFPGTKPWRNFSDLRS